MQKYISFFLIILLLSFSCGDNAEKESETANSQEEQAAPETPEVRPNQLTAEEVAAEWVLLFDGESLDSWHSYKKDTVEGWEAKDGALITDGKNGDLVSNGQYENFEFSFEWRISPKGNSGVMFYVVEGDQYKKTHETGPEYQIVDDNNYKEELADNQKSGANYALHAPNSFLAREPGEYNQGKIILNQGNVEHWLNGEMVLEYELWTNEWEELVASSKFKRMPDYGQARKGHIALQGHGDPVAFRNLKIRPF